MEPAATDEIVELGEDVINVDVFIVVVIVDVVIVVVAPSCLPHQIRFFFRNPINQNDGTETEDRGGTL